MPEPLTLKGIDEDVHLLDAITEQLLQCESSVSYLVRTYAGRKPHRESASGQEITKSLANVQSARVHIAKVLEHMSEIRPETPLFDKPAEAPANVADAGKS